MDREKITFTGAQETMLATLYGKALDSRSQRPILGDHEAARAVDRIDYNFRKTGIGETTAAGVALRSKHFDDWTAEFLAAHPEATVLHLACGLDTRVHRLGPPPSVRWIDVDYPEVIDLRKRLLSEPPGDYRMIAASVTGDGWLDEIPADRPTVAVFEGLTMYLHEADGKRLIRRITERFPSGQLLFDGYGRLGIKSQKLVTIVRNAGATLHWAIDEPREIEALHEGLTCLDDLRIVELPDVAKLPALSRLGVRVMARIPGIRDFGRIMRFSY